MHASIRFAFILSAVTISSYASPVTGWKIGQGAAPLSQSMSANPIVGDNTSGSAKDTTIYASFPKLELLNPGDKITLKGTIELRGITPYAGQLRWGLLDSNKLTGLDEWRGYVVDNASGNSPGQARKRNSGSFMSMSGATSFGQATAKDHIALSGGIYTFSLSYERLRNGSIDIVWELSNAGTYSFLGTANDKTPKTYAFDRAGFLFGNLLHADQVKLKGIDLDLRTLRNRE